MAKRHTLTMESPSGIEFTIIVLQAKNRLRIMQSKGDELPHDVSLHDLKAQIENLYGGVFEA